MIFLTVFGKNIEFLTYNHYFVLGVDVLML